MFNHSPYIPSINLPEYINPKMNIAAAIQRRAASLAERLERRAQYISEDDDEDYREEERHARRHDLREAVFFRREQDALEIAHLEGAVLEANRALEDAKRNLREAKIRIRDRKHEEKEQWSHVNRSVPEIVNPIADDAYERPSQQPVRDYLTPSGNRSRSSTPQPSSSSLPARSRSPSPYRMTPKTESEMPPQPSQGPETIHKETADEANSATQEQVYESFKKLHDLAKEFQTLKQNFVYPSLFEFQKPGSQVGDVITVWARSPPEEAESIGYGAGSEVRGSEGKLAYTRANEGLHTYAYAMEQLLDKLDSVDSWNETGVRTRRRAIVGDIEQEASKLEKYRQKVWCDYVNNL